MTKKIFYIILLFLGKVFYAQPVILAGMTSSGGVNGLGTAIQINGDGTGFKVLASFDSAGGINPTGDLLLASNGKIYGMTKDGGANNAGTIFTLDATYHNYSDIFDFADTLGMNPYGSLIQASNGLLYGMSDSGGTNFFGVIFSIDPATNHYSKLYNLTDSTGSHPKGNFLQVSNGMLYGMTSKGGKGNYGTIFKFDPVLDTVKVLYNFTFSNGIDPQGSLIQAANGKLYGMTDFGGTLNSSGVLFSIDTLGVTFSKLHNFDSSTSFVQTTGANPTGTLLQDTATGKLYGMAQYGGTTAQNGTIFTLDTANHYTDILNFSITNGQFPTGSFMRASDGKFYGMTNSGGIYGEGIIFRIDPSNSNAYTKIHDFNLSDGTNPFGSLIELPQGTGIKSIQSANEIVSVYPNPATGNFNFKININSTQKFHLVVSDAYGDTIYESNITINTEIITLNLSFLAKGVYFAQFLSDNTSEIKKIIIN